MEISDLNHFALPFLVLDHRVELHNGLVRLLSAIDLLLGDLDLDWTRLLGELVMHYVSNVTSIGNFSVVLLLLVYVVMLLEEFLEALACSKIIFLQTQYFKGLCLGDKSALDSESLFRYLFSTLIGKFPSLSF